MKLTLDDIRIPGKSLASRHAKLKPYAATLRTVARSARYDRPESSIVLASDRSLVRASTGLARRKAGTRLKHVIVIGIGGSNLGAKAAYDAMGGAFDHARRDAKPRMLFLDTLNPAWMHAVRSVVRCARHPDELLVNIITKSGGTTETIANAEYVLAAMRKIRGWTDRVVVTTGRESALWHQAKRHGLDVLEIPKAVGGRFSAMSPVGTFPLACAGINVRSMLAGATDMRNRCVSASPTRNPAMASAAALHARMGKGDCIHDTFLFSSELASLGAWYRQLLSESIGKRTTRTGKTVRTGLMPTVSIGSTDLHSMAQLMLAGPRNSVTSFVWPRQEKRHARIPRARVLDGIVPGIAGLDASDLMSAILQGTMRAYCNQRLPFMAVELDRIDERSIGAFMQWRMMETMYLAELLDINAFDQPAVELYKNETRRILMEMV